MFINTGRTNIVLQHTKIIPLTITRNKHRYRTNIDGFEQETRCTGDKDSLTGIYPDAKTTERLHSDRRVSPQHRRQGLACGEDAYYG